MLWYPLGCGGVLEFDGPPGLALELVVYLAGGRSWGVWLLESGERLRVVRAGEA